MHNPGATQSPRRARTAAAAHPPQIAHTVAQICAAMGAALDAVSCCSDVTSHTLTPVIAESIASTTTDHLQRRLVEVLSRIVIEHLEDHGDAAPADLEASLRHAWDAEPAPADLDAAIVAATSVGIDGELLCWETINIESANHIGLIRKEASKLISKLPNTSTSELMGYGWSGLRAALRAYDPGLGFAFSTYACPKINGAIRDGIRAENPLPKRLTTLTRAAAAAEEKLTHELSRVPTYAEIIAFLDSHSSHVHLLPRLKDAASLDELASVVGHDQFCGTSDDDPADDTMRTLLVGAVHDAIGDLDEEARQLIEMLYFEDVSLTEAARRTGSDTRSLRAVKTRAHEQLAATLGSWHA